MTPRIPATLAAVLLAAGTAGCGSDATATSQPTPTAPATTAAATPAGPDWARTDPDGLLACQLADAMVEAGQVNDAPLADMRVLASAAQQSTQPDFRTSGNLIEFSAETAEGAVGEPDEFRRRLGLGTQVIEFLTACAKAGYRG